VKPSDFPPDEGLEVAVVGRSNSGKSSAINALLGARKLARTSKTPGRTQLVNFFGLTERTRIVDLPGYGFARVPAEIRDRWRGMIEGYFAARTSLAGLVVTVDIRRDLTELDVTMLRFAHDLDLETLVLLTKADKLSRGAAAAAGHRVERAPIAPGRVIAFSALKRLGIEPARSQLAAWLDLEAVAGPD
jgi:GTP-binding protein